MKIINWPRRNGKSYALIIASAVTGYPIICNTISHKNHIIELANTMKMSVDVYTYEEWRRPETLRQSHNFYPKILIDEGQWLMEKALEEYMGTDVAAVTMSLPMEEVNLHGKD